jgi:hypothetical protein
MEILVGQIHTGDGWVLRNSYLKLDILSCPSVGLHVFIYYNGSRLDEF